jgi:hypothetical protein
VTAGWVSDEVWAQLDPRAGRLSRRGRFALALAALGAAALVIVVWAAGASGLVRPRLSVDGWASQESGHASFSERVVLANHGWTTARLTAVTTPTRDLHVTGARGLPVHIRPGETVTITVRLAVLDCANPPSGWIPVRARVSHWWGTTSAALDAPSGGGPPLAREACHRAP